MRSFIIIEVEHGEDTDAVQSYSEYLAENAGRDTDGDLIVRDYTVRVDIDPYLTAVSVNAIIDRGTGKVL